MSQSVRMVRKMKYSMESAEVICSMTDALGYLLLYTGIDRLFQGYEDDDPEAKKLGIKTILEGRNLLMETVFIDAAIQMINKDGAEKWGNYLDSRIDNLIEGI